MFSKLTTGLVLSLMLTSTAFAQTKKPKATTTTKATDTKALEAKAAEEARLAAQKKAEEEKALEAKRAAEAKAAAEKASANQTSTGFLGYMKSHFTVSYHGEYSFTRKDIHSANEDDHDIQDLRIMHNPTIIYRPITNWKILATSEFKYTDAEAQGTFINRHYRSLFTVVRENILTEKENGIKMDVGVVRRQFDRNKSKASNYGNWRLNTTLGKKFAPNFTTSTLVQYLHNDPVKEKIAATTWRHSLEIIPSFTWQITDKLSYFFNDDFIINTPWRNNTDKDLSWSHEMNIGVVSYQFTEQQSAYFQFKYLHVEAKPFSNNAQTDDYFDYYIGYTYAFTPKISITPEVGGKMFGSKDGKDFFAEEIKYPEFFLYFDMAF